MHESITLKCKKQPPNFSTLHCLCGARDRAKDPTSIPTDLRCRMKQDEASPSVPNACESTHHVPQERKHQHQRQQHQRSHPQLGYHPSKPLSPQPIPLQPNPTKITELTPISTYRATKRSLQAATGNTPGVSSPRIPGAKPRQSRQPTMQQ